MERRIRNGVLMRSGTNIRETLPPMGVAAASSAARHAPRHAIHPANTSNITVAEPKNNRVRRERYASDTEYADKARGAAREYHNKINPKQPSKLNHGLLAEGVEREVYCAGMDHPVTTDTFTLPEAARALGRAPLTFKRWLLDELIPSPVLRDTVTGYRLYSAGELGVIGAMLSRHEREFSYYTVKHTLTREQLFQAVQGYRSTSV